ncbi:MAG TPA: peptide-methionine (R)-S-oxide reductase MsrB [Candidatus Saccharimonadales bacterium]|nr:peptide-methionine (R)-S-oxide reductase MsrB [Candidatus Saccharimonadales bacterium]
MDASQDIDWKQKLTPEQYHVLREQGTEAPFSGTYLNHAADGMYHCAACGAALFKSSDKYESHMPGLEGWPSFAEVAASDAVVLRDDTSYGMHRTEAVCAKCGGHLGHLFPDTTSPTGQHYCINSVALDFEAQTQRAE